MKKSKLKTVHDYLALIVRKRWWIIITTVVLSGLSIWFSLVFPKSYTSQTMIIIQSRDVPSDFVKDLIGGTTDERLVAIEQKILSRTNVLKIVSEFESQLPEYRRMNDEQKVEKLKQHIQIIIPSEKRSGKFLPTTNIIIAYRDRRPEIAQKIAARLASLFIEQDNKSRELKVFGTAEFLEAELKKVSDDLAKSESALKMLKQRYRFEMPSGLETNLRTLDRLQVQKNGNLEALDRFVTLKMNLERQISETPPRIPQASVEKADPLGSRANSLQLDNYRKKEQEYNALVAKAKPTHPDVRRLKTELDQLRKELAPEVLATLGNENRPGSTEQTMVANPVYQSLTAQLRSLLTDIDIRQREKEWIDAEIDKFNRRLQSMPAVEQEMLTIMRTNADLTKQYEGLKSKLEEAKLASSLESRQKGEQFEIVDPANYPLEPSSPGKSTILLAGLLLSLAAGIAVAVISNIFDRCIRTQSELERFLETPVLVEIPSMVTPFDIKRDQRKKLGWAAIGIVLGCLYCGGLFYMYAKQTTVVRLLDPIIEKITERAAKG